ncbi:SDR family NAD(P)-dependent oxidoreductase [Jeotgalibacillus proteolyticus]|uniref:SDR family NAD(P)-dependent oxidoreductase n=1 Tax=Jeotgalibacillus proteolyticus TaxID=2082395 RepID=UPI003CED0D33
MTVLITGASSGIGESLAIKYAEAGEDLVLAARSIERLHQQKAELSQKYGVQIAVFESDLSLEGSAQKLYKQISDNGLKIHTLINNAGVGLFGEFHITELAKEEAMIQLNITSLTALTKLFGKDMIQSGKGRILNVASVAAYFPGPLMAVYYASKAYVKSFSLALSNEWKDLGVQVSVLCPGATSTGFKDAAELDESKLFQKKIMSAEEVANEAFEQFHKGKEEIIPGAMNRIQTRFGSMVSSKTAAAIVRKTQERV